MYRNVTCEVWLMRYRIGVEANIRLPEDTISNMVPVRERGGGQPYLIADVIDVVIGDLHVTVQ